MREVKNGYSILKIPLEELPSLMDMLLDLLEKDEELEICSKEELNFLINFTESLLITIGEAITLKLTDKETTMLQQIYEQCESPVN